MTIDYFGGLWHKCMFLPVHSAKSNLHTRLNVVSDFPVATSAIFIIYFICYVFYDKRCSTISPVAIEFLNMSEKKTETHFFFIGSADRAGDADFIATG